MILEGLSEAALLRVFYILKTCFNIICILVPIIIILTSMRTMIKYILDGEGNLKNLSVILSKIFVGATIFFIPIIFNSVFSLLKDSPNNKIVSYYKRATLEEVERLEAKEKEELAKQRDLYSLKAKEAKLKVEAENQKKKEQSEKTISEYVPPQSTTPSYTDNTSSGEYGLLKVENGVFYLPNKRATKSSDIPKQSGSHGLNPIFWERLNKLIQDGTKKGYKIAVSSGWRSYDSQLSLWNSSTRSCSTRASWVACPGGSRHGFGIAADLKFNGSSCSQSNWNCNSSAKWVHDNAASYGLKFRLSNEPWHIEPDKVEGGSFGKCQAKC